MPPAPVPLTGARGSVLRLVVRGTALSTVLTGTTGFSSPSSSLPTGAIRGQQGQLDHDEASDGVPRCGDRVLCCGESYRDRQTCSIEGVSHGGSNGHDAAPRSGNGSDGEIAAEGHRGIEASAHAREAPGRPIHQGVSYLGGERHLGRRASRLPS